MRSEEILRSLYGTESGQLRKTAEQLLAHGMTVSGDVMGNIIAKRAGNGKRKILLDAHIDEISFVVTHITPEGFLKIAQYGGVDIRCLPAARVAVFGRECINGVVTAPVPHLSKAADEKKAVAVDELAIDIGMSFEKASELVSPGDRVTFCTEPVSLANDRISAHALDNRAGAAAVLYAAELLSEVSLSSSLTVMLSEQEETGERGAKTGAYAADCDIAVVVDTSFALQPDAPSHKCGVLGEGVMLGISPVLDREETQRLISLAASDGLAYTREVMGGSTGTNADVISLTRGGVKTVLISIPIRNMHTPSEIVSAADIETAARLICRYVSSFEEEKI